MVILFVNNAIMYENEPQSLKISSIMAISFMVLLSQRINVQLYSVNAPQC